jgi:hypothetical protein
MFFNYDTETYLSNKLIDEVGGRNHKYTEHFDPNISRQMNICDYGSRRCR